MKTEQTYIKEILKFNNPVEKIMIKGWVRTRRTSKDFSFIEINDGSTINNIQVIANNSLPDYDTISKLNIGSSVSVTGGLEESPGKGQKWEIKADNFILYGDSPDDYPLQKKRHSDEFLRTIAHLRPRTNKYGAAFRIRSETSFQIHKYFNDNDFFNIHTPIITGSDCEGAGELFQVTTIDLENIQKSDGNTDYKHDFFNKNAKLTVSGQLSAEMFALSLGKVYTFGPTFRAENSNTKRHAAEFWMVEPEVAFNDLNDNMDLAEDMLVNVTTNVMEKCNDDVDLFSKFVDKNLSNKIETIKKGNFERITYTEAIEILEKSKDKFEFIPSYGKDLQTEHEKYLAEKYFKKPVFVFNYPSTIKPFYMRLNGDEKTVAAMDLLVPDIGELIGGSQREERINILEKRMNESQIDIKEYWWYLESRKFGSAPHSGFGLGFERLLMILTGISNIRDIIPFPRTPGNVDF